MSEDVTRIWRMGLPADWTPPGYWCVSFVIPEGDDYVQALQGAIGLLTKSKTWERDETHEGAMIVAKTWEKALYLQPMSVNQDCNPIPVPPITGMVDAKNAAAAIFVQFYRPIIHSLNICALTPGDCEGCVDDIMELLTPYGANEAVRGALKALCADLNELTPEEREELETDCPFVDEFEVLSDNINDNPYDWLNKLSDWLFNWLNATANNIFHDLATVGGLMTGGGIFGFIDDNGGIDPDGGAGFGSSCPWAAIIPFATGQHGWEPVVLALGPYAEWGGDRWWSVIIGGNVQCYIKLDLTEPFHLLGIDFTTNISMDGVSTTSAGGAVFSNGSESMPQYFATPFEGDLTLEFTRDVGGTTQIAVIIGRGSDHGEFDYSNITEVVVHGDGPIPPELTPFVD